MATNKKPSYAKVTTPAGVLIWPKLAAPDEYKGKKTYSAKIRLNEEDSQALIAKIEAELAKFWPIAKAELEEKLAEAKTGKQKAEAKKALEEMKEAEKSYKPAYDDEGNETGEYEFNFKMPDHFVGKDKKPVFMRPDVFDSLGKPLKVVPEIWGGTKAVVAGELRPYNMPIGVGISLRLKAVQILELASAGGSRDAGSYGFGAQEGGFEGSDEEPEGSDSGSSEEDGGDTPSSTDF
jgi:hypothetical protein